MTQQQDVTVRLDDRIRLMSAVLTMTHWPEKSQERKPHGTHAHSRATRKFLEPFRNHEAVKGMTSLLNAGAPLEAIFTLALQLRWPTLEVNELPRWAPPRWNEHLRDLVDSSGLTKFWRDEEQLWQSSIKESNKMFKPITFKPFLKPFFGEVTDELVFMPNISNPTDLDVGVRFQGELICISPPRLAWGDSAPWPFDEDAAYISRTALSQFGRLLMHRYLRENAEAIAPLTETALPVSDQFRARYSTWQEQFTTLFVAGASALYLEKNVSKAEANAYVLMERKAQGMVILPGMVSVLRRYLSEYDNGRYTRLLDFLPVFPKQLRVAAKIVTL